MCSAFQSHEDYWFDISHAYILICFNVFLKISNGVRTQAMHGGIELWRTRKQQKYRFPQNRQAF